MAFASLRGGAGGQDFQRTRTGRHPNPSAGGSSKVWSIKKLDDSIEELCMEWIEDTGARIPLQAVTPSASASPGQVWMRKVPKGAEESVKLILERF
ncbi:hypothetical protein FRB95_004817 [Tulasnella sp. JGI-2019a]|nr:hypothetical protein FRB95_004817 [Tulasnella sp. JGI-2019a]